MTATDDGARRIEGDGTSETAWLAWRGHDLIETIELEAWLRREDELVVVAPHPDDEVLGCGGLVAMHAGRGGRCKVIAVTDGEASHAGVPPWTPANLARERHRESLQGLSRLGVEASGVERLQFPDGGLANREQDLKLTLSRMLAGRAAMPGKRLIVSTWSLDGHPDHEVCGRVAERVAQDLGVPHWGMPVWMWHWASPEDARVPWARLRALNLPAHAMAGKQHALAAHVTQLLPRSSVAGPVLGDAIVARSRRSVEYFFV